MAILDDNQINDVILNMDITPQLREGGEAPESFDDGIGFNRAIASGVGLMNSIFTSGRSLVRNLNDFEDDPEFKPLEEIVRYEALPHYDKLVGTRSKGEFNHVFQAIQQEEQLKQQFSKATMPEMLVGTGVGVLTDPLSLLGGFKIVQGATKGMSIYKNAMLGAAYGGAAIGAQETILQKTKLTQTEEETLHNIGVGTAISGLLGGGLGLFAKKAISKQASEYVAAKGFNGDNVPLMDPKLTGGKVEIDRSVGAAEAKLDDNTPAYFKSWMNRGIAKTTRSPAWRALSNRSPIVNKMADSIFEHSVTLKKHLRGTASSPSVEALVDEVHQSSIRQLSRKFKDEYMNYLGVPKDGLTPKTIKAFQAKRKNKKLMSGEEFSREVGRAMRAGDTHTIPQVASAARLIRGQIDTAFKEMQRLKILSDDITEKEMKEYFTTLWNRDKIHTNIHEFEQDLRNYFRGSGRDAFGNDMVNLTDEAVEEQVEIAKDAITAKDNSRFELGLNRATHDMFLEKGTITREKTVVLPKHTFGKYTEEDAMFVANTYLDQAYRMIEFKKMLQRDFKVDNLPELMKNLAEERMDAINNNPKLAKQIDAEYKDAKNLISDMSEMVFNKIRDPKARALRYLSSYQVNRMLGMVTVSSLPDLALLPFRQGLKSVVRDGYAPMIRELGDTLKGVKSGAKQAGEKIDEILALEAGMNDILEAITEGAVGSGERLSKLDRAMLKANRFFGKMSLLTYYDDFNRMIGARVSSAKIIRNTEKWVKGTIDEADKVRLLQLGIDENSAKQINKLLKKGTIVKTEGSFLHNMEQWSGPGAQELKDRFAAAILKDTKLSGLRPSRGDIPVTIQKSHVASSLALFKNFMFVATNRILLSGIQRSIGGEATKVATGIIGLIGMGIMVNILRTGEVPDTSDPDAMMKTVYDGMSRAGIFGLMEIPLALNPHSVSNRYVGKRASSVVFGPSYSLVDDSVTAFARMTDGEVTDKDMNAIKKLVPYQNWVGFHIFSKILGDEE